MARRISLVFLTLSAIAMLLTFLVPGSWSSAVFALLAATFPVALMALGASRSGRLGPAARSLAVLAVLLVSSVVGLLVTRGQPGSWWGLPPGAFCQLIGLFVLPLGVTSLGYARSFETWGLRDADLAALRRRFPIPRDPGPRQNPGSRAEAPD